MKMERSGLHLQCLRRTRTCAVILEMAKPQQEVNIMAMSSDCGDKLACIGIRAVPNSDMKYSALLLLFSQIRIEYG